MHWVGVQVNDVGGSSERTAQVGLKSSGLGSKNKAPPLACEVRYLNRTVCGPGLHPGMALVVIISLPLSTPVPGKYAKPSPLNPCAGPSSNYTCHTFSSPT